MTISLLKKASKYKSFSDIDPEKFVFLKEKGFDDTLKIFFNPSTSRKIIAVAPTLTYGSSDYSMLFLIERPPTRRSFRFHNKSRVGMPYTVTNPLFPYEYNAFVMSKNERRISNSFHLYPSAPCFHSPVSLRENTNFLLLDLLPNMENRSHSMCIGTVAYDGTASRVDRLVKNFYEFLANTTYNSHILNLGDTYSGNRGESFQQAFLISIVANALQDQEHFADFENKYPYLTSYISELLKRFDIFDLKDFPFSHSPPSLEVTGNTYSDFLDFISHPHFPGWNFNEKTKDKVVTLADKNKNENILDHLMRPYSYYTTSPVKVPLVISPTPIKTYDQFINNFIKNSDFK